MKQPIKILHVLGSLNRGGVESWLYNVLKIHDRSQFQHDFLLHAGDVSGYEQEVLRFGSRIFHCPNPAQRPLAYILGLRRVLKHEGPFDIVHSHLHFFSGIVLAVAKRVGIACRIAHSHNDTSSVDASASIFRKSYLCLMRFLLNRCGAAFLACSGNAADALFGSTTWMRRKCSIIHYGVDTHPALPGASITNRTGLKIPSSTFVVGHVGRFFEQKNHRFILEIFRAVRDTNANAHLLLVGDGPLKSQIEKQVAMAGLTDCVTFAGARSDVPALMRDVMDVLVFPSLHEGLPVVVLEAQAAGLPCVISDAISREVDIVPGMVRRSSLADAAMNWAEIVLATAGTKGSVAEKERMRFLAEAKCASATSAGALAAFYDQNRMAVS